MERTELVRFLDSSFEKVEDDAPNGLQFEGRENVEKVALAVDARLSTIERAIERKADLLFVHHLLIFKPWERITAFEKRRVKALLKGNLNLYGQHLPLDMHERWGNNAQIAKKLGLDGKRNFAHYHGFPIGFSAFCDLSFEELAERVRKEIGDCETVETHEDAGRVRIASGGSWKASSEVKEGETFITGDLNRVVEIRAREAGFNAIFAGHYATEKFGVKAVGEALKGKGLEVFFIDEPTLT